MSKKGVSSLQSMMATRAPAKREEEEEPQAAADALLPAADDVPVPINIYVSDADRTRLRMFALERKTSVQALGHRAWNLLLKEEGLPPLAPASSYVPSGTKRRK